MQNLLIANPGQAFMQGNANALNIMNARDDRQQTADMRNLFRTQGAGIAAGEPNALAAYAQLDPLAARQVSVSQEKIEMARASAAREAEKYARTISAQEAAAESAKIDSVLQGAMLAKDEASHNAWLTQNGIDPAQYPFAQRDIAFAAAMGAKEVLDLRAAEAEMNAPPTPLSAPGKVQYDINQGSLAPDTPLRGAGVTVSTAPPPKQGYRNVFDERGNLVRQEVIPGGPADTSQAEAASAETKVAGADIVLNALDRAETLVRGAPFYDPAVGLGSGITENIRGSTTNNYLEVIKPIEASIGFDRLQRMRDESPTGGALGQVSERELALLAGSIASLGTAQDADNVLKNIKIIRDVYSEIMRKAAAYPNAAKYGFAPGNGEPTASPGQGDISQPPASWGSTPGAWGKLSPATRQEYIDLQRALE